MSWYHVSHAGKRPKLLNEFEFIEDFKRSAYTEPEEYDLGKPETEDWRPVNYKSSDHTVKLMVLYYFSYNYYAAIKIGEGGVMGGM